MTDKFEADIWKVTQSHNDQYPRPWMTALSDPSTAHVFVVGMNQNIGYSTDDIDHSQHIDALFNRNGLTCRGMYDKITANKPSDTRINIDRLIGKLVGVGVRQTLVTNVICYSTPISRHLLEPEHQGGVQHGAEIFNFLLFQIRPAVLIVHGAGTLGKIKMVLPAPNWPTPPTSPGAKIEKDRLDRPGYNPIVYPIPSLAPPEFNKKWYHWSDEYLNRLAEDLAFELARYLESGPSDDRRKRRKTLEEGMAAESVGFDKIIERGVGNANELSQGVVYAGFSLGVLPAQKLAQTRKGARGALLFHSCVPISEFGSAWRADARPDPRDGCGPDLRQRRRPLCPAHLSRRPREPSCSSIPKTSTTAQSPVSHHMTKRPRHC